AWPWIQRTASWWKQPRDECEQNDGKWEIGETGPDALFGRGAGGVKGRVFSHVCAVSNVLRLVCLGAFRIQPFLQLERKLLRAFAGEGGYGEYRAVPAQLIDQALLDRLGVVDHVDLVEHQPARLFVEPRVVA